MMTIRYSVPSRPTAPAAASASSSESECALVAELLARSDAAWREFHTRYGRLIFRCIASVTSRFTPLLGGDDVYEIYATLLYQLLANDMRKLRSFDPERGKRLASWIGLLATHSAYDYLRAQRRDRERATLSEADTLASDAPDPFDQFNLKQRASTVSGLLSEFSEKDREFILLYFTEGLEAEEVALRMGISVKTVYSKKHKIRTRLEALLSLDRLAA